MAAKFYVYVYFYLYGYMYRHKYISIKLLNRPAIRMALHECLHLRSSGLTYLTAGCKLKLTWASKTVEGSIVHLYTHMLMQDFYHQQKYPETLPLALHQGQRGAFVRVRRRSRKFLRSLVWLKIDFTKFTRGSPGGQEFDQGCSELALLRHCA